MRYVLCAVALAATAVASTGESAQTGVAGQIVDIPGGTFLMGSEAFHAEEAPVHQVTVAPFRIMATEVTNAEFGAFVTQTGYVTIAERGLDPAEHPDWPPELLVPGLDGVSDAGSGGWARRHHAVVVLSAWRDLARARGAGQLYRGHG